MRWPSHRPRHQSMHTYTAVSFHAGSINAADAAPSAALPNFRQRQQHKRRTSPCAPCSIHPDLSPRHQKYPQTSATAICTKENETQEHTQRLSIPVGVPARNNTKAALHPPYYVPTPLNAKQKIQKHERPAFITAGEPHMRVRQQPPTCNPRSRSCSMATTGHPRLTHLRFNRRGNRHQSANDAAQGLVPRRGRKKTTDACTTELRSICGTLSDTR